MAEAPKPFTKTLSKPISSENRSSSSDLSPEELLALWREFKQKPSHGKLRETLILRYLHLVRYVVNRLPMTLPVSISFEDLVSYGTIGLMESVERFDPERGLKFETYAITRIRGAIIDQLRLQDWVPRGVRKRSKELGETMARMEERLGRAATDDELSEALGVSKAKLHNMLAESNNLVISLNDSWGTEGDGQSVSLIDMVEDKNSPDPEGEFEAEEMSQRLARAIDSLPEREKLLIALYYHENMTLKEIGEVISVSESRVCQLHAQAIMRLRNKLAQ